MPDPSRQIAIDPERAARVVGDFADSVGLTVPSTADVTRVAGEVAQLVDDIRAHWSNGSPLARNGGPWCKYCPLLDDCAEGKSAGALLG